MIAAGLGGHGAQHRGRSAFYDQQLDRAMHALLELGGAEFERHRTRIGDKQLHYIAAGEGAPLLLLHGASGGAANWYRLIAPLARRHHVLVPDLPGFGFSDAIESKAPLGRQVAALLAEWLRTLGVRQADVVGTSFGGLAGLRLAQLFPVRRLVVTDTVGLTRRLPWLLRLATLPLGARLAVAPSRRGTRWLLRHALTAGGLPAVHEGALVDYLYASARRTDARMMVRAFRQFAGLTGQRDVLTVAELAALADRLLVLWGERDTFLPAKEVERVCTLAGCKPVRMIPDAGHSPNWEQPHRVLHEIESFFETAEL